MEPTPPALAEAAPITIDDIANTVRLLAMTTRDDTRPSSNLVQPSLIAQLRTNIVPDGDGAGARRKAANDRSPINVAALTLYEWLKGRIDRLYEEGTDRRPNGSPEELLVSWYVELAVQAAAGELTQAQYDRLHSRLEEWRTRIMDLLNPPERMEIPHACPECGWERVDRTTTEGEVRQYALVGMSRPWRNEEGVKCRAPGCGAEWMGEGALLELAADIGIDVKKILATLHTPVDEPEIITAPAKPIWLCVMTNEQARQFSRDRGIDQKQIVVASGPTRRLRHAVGPIRIARKDTYAPGPHETARVNEAIRISQVINAMNGYDTEGNPVQEQS